MRGDTRAAGLIFLVQRTMEPFPMARRAFVAALAIIAMGIPSIATAGLIGFSFYGENTAYSAQPGDIGGGYYVLDPDVPAVEGSDGPNWSRPYMGWDIPGLPGAIDDSLADTLAPFYPRGQYVKAFNYNVSDYDKEPVYESAAVIRYGPDGDYDFFNVYTNEGPAVQAGDTLGSFIASHGVRDIFGGVRYTGIEEPVIQQFTLQDILGNENSFLIRPVGGAMHASFEPHLEIGGFDDVPMLLSHVAALAGFDHFNWIQWVTFDNDPNRPIVKTTGRQVDAPYLDPPLGGYAYQLYGDDFLDGYWAEGDELRYYTHGDYYLEFLDYPGVTDGSLVEFKTALAGIDTSGNATLFPESLFYWQSTSKGVSVRKNTDLSLITEPAVTLRGVFPDVRLSAEDIAFLASQGISVASGAGHQVIPEPSTFAIWSLLGVCGITIGWRRRKTA
ncbi:MAG TPA: hypothetical protein VMY37_16090 [Thermoguttaceae bacterium]|nr:hypothetical protein [Thermoguttaceae bacterium]